MDTKKEKRLAEIKKLLVSDKSPRGKFTRSSDGKVFFLTTEDMKQCAVPKGDVAKLDKLMEGSHGITPSDATCDRFFKWLTTHNPNTIQWRKISLFWIDYC
jgi:hypothetical protein